MKSKFQVAHLQIFLQIKEAHTVPFSQLLSHQPKERKRERDREREQTKTRSEMTQMLSILRRNLQNLRKSPRVADETEMASTTQEARVVAHNERRDGANAVMMRFPFSIISCFAVPRVSGTDGLWMSGDYASVSEVNHLMVSDGMRYAILM